MAAKLRRRAVVFTIGRLPQRTGGVSFSRLLDSAIPETSTVTDNSTSARALTLMERLKPRDHLIKTLPQGGEDPDEQDYDHDKQDVDHEASRGIESLMEGAV